MISRAFCGLDPISTVHRLQLFSRYSDAILSQHWANSALLSLKMTPTLYTAASLTQGHSSPPFLSSDKIPVKLEFLLPQVLCSFPPSLLTQEKVWWENTHSQNQTPGEASNLFSVLSKTKL